MLPPGIRTVAVPTFVNETTEPLLEAEITRAVIAEIQRDGALRIVAAGEADAVLKGRIRAFTMNPVSYTRDDALRAEEYRIILTAAYTLVNAKTGAVVSEHPQVEGDATFQVIGDLTTSKQNGLPTAARDLAHDLVEKIVETWR